MASIVATGLAFVMAGGGLGPAPHPDPGLLAQCTGTAPITCTFDVPPGHYDVTVALGNRQEAARTEVLAEARRLMVPATDSAAGELVRRTFTVNVRDPEGQQNSFAGPGTPGLTLTFTGPAPKVSGIGLAPAATPRLFLAGDSTVTDQETAPYTGWGQRLPRWFRHGLSVVNHSGSGESTVSFLAEPAMWAAMRPQLRPGDVALVQFGHNDKQTTAEQFRANLTEIVDGIRATGATPVLVTPIVRRWFTGDRLNATGLIVNGLGVDLPAEMRAVAASKDVSLIDLTARSQAVVEDLGPEAAKALYLTREKRDDTHTSEYGASVYSDLVAAGLTELGLVPDRYWNR
ncbi:lysophospholipase L1-like esterase [Kribbella amoyensis]|uniref:Lysophospholipase L1-like esterase n=1 Tax=Kribbella amoyensis TaxID=996641 RepID=A0A561C1G5_9ACTN|nr:rhamnogalacturonan acetylesterase [Kribbella amoyensis]TWD84897.1 lysophospholipase L1-like esterase [Kribbella amoyensis]